MRGEYRLSLAALSSPPHPLPSLPPPLLLFLLLPSFQGRCEWESDSGRQITLQDVEVTELSRVELQVMQRIAITKLQDMDIPVSHGMLKGLPLFGNNT